MLIVYLQKYTQPLHIVQIYIDVRYELEAILDTKIVQETIYTIFPPQT